MGTKIGHGLAVAVLATFATASGSYLEAVRGTDGAGRTVDDITAGKPAVVLLTSPRVAAVSSQLQQLRVLAEELGDAAVAAAVIYGEDPGKLAKLRAGLPFPVVAGEGDVPLTLLGDEGALPMALLATRKGNVVRRYADVPGPLTVAEVLRVRYDPGPPRSPKAGELLPDLVLPASDGEFYNLRALSLMKAKTLVFIIDAKDETSRAALAPLQYLADDLGDELEVVPVILGASDAVAAKLAEAENVDIPVLAAGPLAARRLAGKLELPVMIFTGEKGTVAGVRERATVPTREEVLAEESAPAAEGEPVALAVASVSRLTEGLQSDVVPTASFDAAGRYVVFCGRFRPREVDHLYEVTTSGKKLRQISMAAAPDVAPSCSPDGVHIAFISGRSGGSEIWTCERVHGEFTQISKSGGAYAAPNYSLDGRWLVAARKVKTGGDENFDLWVVTPRGRRERPVAETFYDEIEPAFSADGNRVFFASRRYGNWDVFSSDLKGGKRRRLTGPETDDRMPAPSPDGKYVVYAGKGGGGRYKLWAMNVDGSSKVQLTSGAGDDLYPRFARDGDALVFVSSRTGSLEVYKIKFAPTPDYDLPRPARPLVSSEFL
ncbi:MAG: hypothetical protein GTN49_12425 [candidate division Zixibacteria bacterium]|nr:hypothetical protein [candidate division Zixibacteria bacterium]